jgi:origin recognition complex subunit 1
MIERVATRAYWTLSQPRKCQSCYRFLASHWNCMATGTSAYPQTPRRSRRGQPAVEILPRSDDNISLSHKIYERPAEPNDTIDPAEEFQIDSQTTFYQSFSRYAETGPKYARRGGSKATKKKNSTYYGTFTIGDTVLVNTSGNRTIHPSIGVIAQILATDEDSSTTRVRIHWFLRPSELPRIRAKHDHSPVRLTLTHLPVKT